MDGKNPVPPRPYFYIYSVRFRIYGKIRKWDGKREEVYPARICEIPFLAGIIPYFSRIYKIRKKIPSRPPYFYIYPVRFRIYGKIQKYDGKWERVYPARICGIPFLVRIIPYFSVFIKSGEKMNRHTIYPLIFLNINICSSTSIHIFHDLIVGNKKYWSYFWKIACVKECLVLYSCKMSGD